MARHEPRHRRFLALLLLVVTIGSGVVAPVLDRDFYAGGVVFASQHDPGTCHQFHHSHLLCVQQQHSGWMRPELPVPPVAIGLLSPLHRRPDERPRVSAPDRLSLPRAPPLS